MPCTPNSAKCDGDVPLVCSDQGVWDTLAACVAPMVCSQGRCRPPGRTECRFADNTSVEVQWQETTTPAGPGYSVRSIGGSRTAPGWQLRHRPAPSASDDYRAPDIVITGDAIIDYPVARDLIPVVSQGVRTPGLLPILICPDGTCAASPALTECETFYEYRAAPGQPPRPRIAVVGDALVRDNETCQGDCAVSLEQTLGEWGYSSWVTYHDGQGSYRWLNAVRAQALTRPDILVLAVAAHEAQRHAATPETDRAHELRLTQQYVQEAIRVMRATNPATGIVLVTTTERGTLEYRQAAELLNEMLWQTSRESGPNGNMLVAGWEVVASSHCGAAWVEPGAPGCELFDADQLHLQKKGDELRNQIIVFTIAYTLKPDN